MDNTALYKLIYGVFVLTAKDGRKDNGCIINTATQVASTPLQISVSICKLNYTHDMVLKTGAYTLSVLSEDADYELYKHFGFLSGKDTDKFVEFKDCERDENGIFYLTKGTNAFISVKVEKTIDLGSHTMFIGSITNMKTLNSKPSATYDYYLNHVKPKPADLVRSSKEETVWRCRICGHEYVGEELPEDFICPICKHPASDFEKVTTKE